MAFPNVPNVPGVPALPRAPGAVAAVVQLLTADALSLFGGLDSPPWGLFLDGVPVVTAESVVSFDFKKGARISSFPVEDGGFESYNKVQQPYDVRMRFATGDTPAARQALLESVAAAIRSLSLMDAVSPEAVYPNVNPVHYDYRRTAQNGVGLIQVDVFCEEVRVRAASTFSTSASSATSPTASDSNTAGSGATTFNDRFPTTAPIVAPLSPTAAPVINDGTVQPVPVSATDFSLSQALP
jgi:hypothetical protein